MRILLVSDYLYGGGAERMAYELFLGLNENGHNAKLICAAERISSVKDKGIELLYAPETRPMPPSEHLEKYKSFLDMVYEFNPDLVHIHNIHGSTLPLQAVFQLAVKYPVCWTMHDVWPVTGGCCLPYGCSQYKNPAGCGNCPDDSLDRSFCLKFPVSQQYGLMQNLWRRSNNITAVCPSDWMRKQIAAAELSRNLSDITVIHNGIKGVNDILNVPPFFRKLNPPLVLVMATSLKLPLKGSLQALEIFRKLAEANKFSILWVGNGSRELSEEASSFCTSMALPYTDNRSDIDMIYRNCDILFMPSLYENFPTTILEAMSAGLIVVAHDVGGVSEQLKDGETGFIYKTEKDAELKLGTVLKMNELERKKMGKNALHEFQKRFSLDVYVKRHIELYKSVHSSHTQGTEVFSVGKNSWNYLNKEYTKTEISERLKRRNNERLRRRNLEALRDRLVHSRLDIMVQSSSTIPCRIALYGAGIHTKWLLGKILSTRKDIIVNYILDDSKSETDSGGIPIINPSALLPSAVDAVIPSSELNELKMSIILKNIFGDNIRVFRLYENLNMDELLKFLPEKRKM
ncbi:MAG: hypothetical protein A2017_07545 [Lentisphaerae bacterium GWF2_44_16]|nr:MAG: hypothetical protein A2017_07545 [Lentisphaerae bacterium GWF2_44_16]